MFENGINLDSMFHVPVFHRLEEYAGVWAMEPSAAAVFAASVRGINLASHIAEANERIRANGGRAVKPNKAGQPLNPMAGPAPSLTEPITVKGGKDIAMIRAVGTLMKQESSMGGTSTIQLRKEIRSAVNNPQVGAILLAIDSPGGTVSGIADLASEVKNATRKKPVYAHIDDLGASAAYWMASQADQIFAGNATAKVGSIGTFQVVYDYSGAAAAEGIKTLVFATGPLKGLGAMGAPVTDEQQVYLQSMINESQTHFDSAVRSGRGMNATQLAAVRHGGVFPAGEAVEKRLIDGIRSLEKTIEALAAAR